MTPDETIAHLAAAFDKAYVANNDDIFLKWIAQGLSPDDLDEIFAAGAAMYEAWRHDTLAAVRQKPDAGEEGWHL